jgi:LacI family repressor for deo operon, udp, cdd, tsx, nupC, and nupG
MITADFSDPFFSQVVVGAEAEARKHGYFFLLCSTERNPQDEPEYLRLLGEREVDGILFSRPSTEEDPRHIVSLIRRGVPLVTTSYHVPGEDLTVVDVDNEDGGYKATQHLVDYGHRAIGMITGPPDWKSVKDRSTGFRLALAHAGIEAQTASVVHGDWSYASGYHAATRLFRQTPHASGLFVQNDRMAIGAMRAMREMHIRVPEDVAVVGYDDILPAAYSSPPLSTVRQPMQEVGQLATQLLIEAIGSRDVEKKEVLLKTELIVRASSGHRRA